MKLLRFDSVGGASGDMILGALIALGASRDEIQRQLATLGIETFELQADPVTRQGFSGTELTVRIPPEHHPHRHLSDIRGLLERSALPPATRDLALAVFQRLAEAEARVHGTTPDRIHFHEVGAMDSIIDIVGSCIALNLLDVGHVTVGPLPMGVGTIQCDHGVLPNPAPATVQLLADHPVSRTDEPFELVTPTGAALLLTWQGNFPPAAAGPMRIAAEGIGFGHRTLNQRPNLLRAMIMESARGVPVGSDDCHVIECNLDDTVPELLGSLAGRLMEAGALDAFTTAVQMKKQRPGTLLTVLCTPATRDKMLDLIFTESTTFGVREYAAARTILARRHVSVTTPYGPVRVKVGTWKGNDVTRSPEHDDCVACASRANVSVRAVYEAAIKALQ